MEYAREILAALRDEGRFVRLVLSGPKDSAAEWKKITVRPIRTARGRILQALLQGARKQIARELKVAELDAELDELLRMGFLNIALQCTDRELHIRITRKGKVLASRGKPSLPGAQVALEHDREKEYPFPADQPNDFLEALGVMKNGRVLASAQDKFRQINHFLMLLSHTRLLREPRSEKLHLVDCGCGKAFLTLAACRFIKSRGMKVRLTGVDADAKVIAAAARLRDKVGERDVDFVQARILDYRQSEPIDGVMSLHACDTATDEAIAQGVRWGAKLILCAPCCQHELHHNLARPEFRAALRHGILRERIADIITDALRAAALRVMGYSTDVIEFVSPAHTPRNLMIRAEKVGTSPLPGSVREYCALRDFWNVRPALERLLDLQKRVAQP